MASTWAATANNETISFNNLQNGVDTGVLSQKAAIPASNEQITKADANTYVNINTSFAPYAAKASNQLVVKSNLQSTVAITTTTDIEWNGINNNQTTSSPIQLLAGISSAGGGRINRSTDYGVNYSNVLAISDGLRDIKFNSSFRHASYLSVPPFLAVGNGGRIVTNSVTDCSSWVTISSPTTQDLYSIAFSSTIGIVVGTARIIKTNTNNRINAWSIVNSLSVTWYGVASNGSIFVAVGGFSSPSIITGDSLGTTWTSRSMPPLSPSTISLRSVTYHSDTYFYAVGYTTGTLDPYIMRSTDNGVSWELFTPSGDSFIGILWSINSIGNRLIVGGKDYQYQIINNVVTRYNASVSGNILDWVASVKDANSNGFDMAANSSTGTTGAYSNF